MGKYSDFINKYHNDKFVYQHFDCFHQKCDRTIAEKKLKGQPEGTFLLRDSSIKGGSYVVISCMKNQKIEHQLICLEQSRFKQQEPGSIFVDNLGEHLDKNYDGDKALVSDRYIKKMMSENKEIAKAYVQGAGPGFFESIGLPGHVGEYFAKNFLGLNDKQIALLNKKTATGATKKRDEALKETLKKK